MKRRLKCVILDDDQLLLEILVDACKDSRWVKVVKCFNSPKEFLNAVESIHFDLCIIDVVMPEMDGMEVVKRLGSRPVIFITGATDRLKDALDVAPIDVVTKPVNKDRLEKAFKKAYKCLRKDSNTKYALFNVAESENKIRLALADILFVKSDIVDPRNKSIYLKSGTCYTLMNYTFDYLLDLSNSLIKINRTELVSMKAVEQVRHDLITLKLSDKINPYRQVTLSDGYRKEFMEIVNSA